ncbi:hypothetical protein F5Y16DRAFT_370247 [Xylariaceae sp. FL0255]|nr:hypothetical protein F5Y16DRAFT_370247 [Xylariaceae sp. FL0255]
MSGLGKGVFFPPLPPRAGDSLNTPNTPFKGLYNDPRTSSTQSLTPSLPEYEEIERRKLLIVYIHGFMGNDTSFQSFPTHVHKYLKLSLADTHVIHSKIYPRYKTYKSIEFARDNFSKWLEPHESPNTDVVLVGHSMGGLIAADVVLMPSQDRSRRFKHHILGTVHLDVPLLGMHPGIVISGISSLFRKKEPPKPAGEPSIYSDPGPGTSNLGSPPPYSPSIHSDPSTSSLSSPPPPFAAAPTLGNDENFNPNFVNDVRIQERGWWRNVMHFVDKHNSEGLIDAARKHVKSHLEFGGALADISSLKTRYETIRKLEDIDDLMEHGSSDDTPRVRFVQYYTVCHGYPKTPKPDSSQRDLISSPGESGMGLAAPTSQISTALPPAPPIPSLPSLPSHNNIKSDSMGEYDSQSSILGSERSSLELMSPEPLLEENSREEKPVVEPDPEAVALSNELAALEFGLPPVPELPAKPEPPNLDQYTDKDARKQAEKEAKRVQKAYDQAVRDRLKTIKEREKIIEKRKKRKAQEEEKAKKDSDKKAKEDEKAKKREDDNAGTSAIPTPAPVQTSVSSPLPTITHETSLSPSISRDTPTTPAAIASSTTATTTTSKKPPKDRTFCNIAKDSRTGEVDSRWIRVYMKDMDEVAAHTGLFFAGEHYERLVGDVSGTIVDWVHAELTRRAILALG